MCKTANPRPPQPLTKLFTTNYTAHPSTPSLSVTPLPNPPISHQGLFPSLFYYFPYPSASLYLFFLSSSFFPLMTLYWTNPLSKIIRFPEWRLLGICLFRTTIYPLSFNAQRVKSNCCSIFIGGGHVKGAPVFFTIAFLPPFCYVEGITLKRAPR